MVTGINSDIVHNGKVYHVQTEDGGVNNPIVLTRTFFGGVVISSKKTSYVYLLERDDLRGVVEQLMNEQHKEMIQAIYKGNFLHDTT
ncbi:MAG: hypothetical protein A2Y48_01130 [Nitrospirae bacterium RIFCSPLOW2_12_42_9]|nr:MAG: hypothetical protein A2Z60_01835 [Nitrospirae bacterium RIFCSPLOWO2_02_42_7]OGW57997.1 MAG: hypothetical protein A2Y48_01130 [Nitrospirae bacterium RIFCSPLOW2_12_42_9]OGW59922.1 MAG: hypothetical protein A3D21_04770 [Nitrospirae bacterium RIFCSPHIGHO2_02_FULL_42_12]HAS17789.1 hypothetical protein [Nitrospiraceae bacterium]